VKTPSPSGSDEKRLLGLAAFGVLAAILAAPLLLSYADVNRDQQAIIIANATGFFLLILSQYRLAVSTATRAEEIKETLEEKNEETRQTLDGIKTTGEETKAKADEIEHFVNGAHGKALLALSKALAWRAAQPGATDADVEASRVATGAHDAHEAKMREVGQTDQPDTDG
jgi:hypothetical protein